MDEILNFIETCELKFMVKYIEPDKTFCRIFFIRNDFYDIELTAELTVIEDKYGDIDMIIQTSHFGSFYLKATNFEEFKSYNSVLMDFFDYDGTCIEFIEFLNGNINNEISDYTIIDDLNQDFNFAKEICLN